jgi:aryl-alcohol dehydrogenase-like predicted oxidoreductase
MGCVKLGSGALADRRVAIRLVHQAYDAGVRLFDTADAYAAGASESVLGEALAGRDDAVVATKVGYLFRERSSLEQALRAAVLPIRSRLQSRARPRRSEPAQEQRSRGYAAHDFSPDHVRAAVDASRRRLRRDRLDLVQLHGPPPPEQCPAVEVLDELVGRGSIQSIGVGCERLESAVAWSGVEAIGALQVPFGVLDPQAANVLPALRERGLGTIVRGALGGGVLGLHARRAPTGLDPVRSRRVERLEALAREHGVDLLQIAMWYALHAAPNDAVLIGMSSPDQVDAAVRMATAPVPDAAVVAHVVAIVEDEASA